MNTSRPRFALSGQGCEEIQAASYEPRATSEYSILIYFLHFVVSYFTILLTAINPPGFTRDTFTPSFSVAGESGMITS